METSGLYFLMVAGDDDSGRVSFFCDKHAAVDRSLQELIIIMKRPT